MKVEMVPTSFNVVTGQKQCVFCRNNFSYAAHVNGKVNLEELKMVNPDKGVTDQVIVLKKSLINN
jgi:translation initiation factor IF-1